MKSPGEWQKKTIDDLFIFTNGNGFKATDWSQEGLPIIRIQNLNGSNNYNYYNGEIKETWLVNPGQLLFAWAGTRGISFGPHIWTGPQGVLNQHIYKLEPKIDGDLRWLHYALIRATEKIEKKAHGFKSTLVHVQKSDITNQVVRVPPLAEQKAIADLLSTWDEAIEKTKRLVQTKEANLTAQIQGIMGREAVKAKGWPMTHLGELFSEVTRKVGENELTPYSISAGIGFVSQREKWGKDISGSQHKNYTHLKAGEFSYNKGNSKHYQQGCVYLLKEGEICVPNVFISFKPRTKNIVPEFFEHYFIADYHARELKRYITSGARSDGLLNLNKKDFFKILVPCPPPNAQKSIAEALTAAQQEINLLKQLAEKYRTQKRGLMQKILTGEWRVKQEIVNQYMEA